VLAVVVAVFVLALAVRVWRAGSSLPGRRWATIAAGLVVVQVGLGVASVLTVLAVLPVSLHTLVAAGLLASLVFLAVHSSSASVRCAARVGAAVA
jgi:heme A synthase